MIAVALLLCGLFPSGMADEALAALQGNWQVMVEDRGGLIKREPEGVRVEIAGNRFTTTVKGELVRAGTLSVDGTQEPRTIDASYTKGPLEGKTVKGIYSFDGDRLIMCYSAPGEDRPKQMPASAKQDQVRLVMRKVR